MENLIEWLKEYDYIMLLAGALLLVWLVWIPRIVAPFLIPRYDKFPPKLKAAVNLILPTIEKIMLDSWDGFYSEVIKEIVEETPTELDNKVWQEIDEFVSRKLREKDVGYYPKEEVERHG
jgi:hypothetical protein